MYGPVFCVPLWASEALSRWRALFLEGEKKKNDRMTRHAGAHLRVCIEDLDPLGRDEQIHLSEGLRFSVCTLLQDKKKKKKKDYKKSVSVPSGSNFYRSRLTQ